MRSSGGWAATSSPPSCPAWTGKRQPAPAADWSTHWWTRSWPDDGRTVRVSSSIGLAMARPGSTFDEVLRAADDAMYAAKDSGRGGLHLLET
jgi:GGDEF domain-containing protein